MGQQILKYYNHQPDISACPPRLASDHPSSACLGAISTGAGLKNRIPSEFHGRKRWRHLGKRPNFNVYWEKLMMNSLNFWGVYAMLRQQKCLRSVCWICLFQSSLIHFQSGRPSKADAWYFPHLVFHRRIHF